VHVSRLSAAASEFRAALVEAFVRHSGLIFLVTAIPFGLLFVLYVESGNMPIAPDTVVTPDSLHPLHGFLVLAVYGLAGLVLGLFVWVGIPVLILSFAVWLSKLDHRETEASAPDPGPARRHSARRQRHPGGDRQRLHDSEPRDGGNRPRGRLPGRQSDGS